MRNLCLKFYRLIADFFHRHPYWFVFLLSFLLSILMMLPNMIAGKGVFSWIDDYSHQEITFNTHLNEVMSEGGEVWEPHNDLGASTIGSYSFYNLASPFVVILWLFPASVVPYLLGFMYAVKYAVAGLTAFMFLKRMVKNQKYALIGSLLYAFSGFQFTNMLFYHFHDCVALFPLLLYGLDRLIKDNKRFIFLFAVALNLFTNYFFFIGEVVFLIIYYLVLCITKHYKFTWKKTFQIILEGIIGVGLAGIILIPSLLFVRSNPRVNASWTLKDMFWPGLRNILEIIRAFTLPNESMTYRSMIQGYNWHSFEAYLPFVGSILWLAYLIKKPKNPFSILTFVLGIFLIVPILNNSFVMFTGTYYARWLYMLILILALLSAKTLEEGINLKPGFIGTGIALLCYLLIATFIVGRGENFIYNQRNLLVILSVFLASLLCLAGGGHKPQLLFRRVLIGVCAYIVIYGSYFCWIHRAPGDVSLLQEQRKLLESYEDDIRYNDNLRNGSYFGRRMSVSSWNSNVEGTAFEFYSSIGMGRGVMTDINFNEHALQDFLSAKYLVTNRELDHDLPYSLKEQTGRLWVYENKDYLPFGIDYATFITPAEFDQLDFEERKKLLKETVVLTPEQAKDYQTTVSPYQGKKRKSKITANDFKLIKNGFESNITLQSDALVVYTFAYSNNFKATLNGEPVKLEKVDNGVIGVKLNQGENHLKVIYDDFGVKIGAAITGLSVLGLAVYAVIVMKNRK